jgi:hypothetical protein
VLQGDLTHAVNIQMRLPATSHASMTSSLARDALPPPFSAEQLAELTPHEQNVYLIQVSELWWDICHASS